MYNFVQNRSKFLILFFYSVTAFAMQLEIVPQKKTIVSSRRGMQTPDQTIQVFEPKKEFKIGSAWSKVVPGNIIITPDDKGIIIAERGRIKQCLFDDQENKVKIIIEHVHAKKHCPFVAVDCNQKGENVIFSAGNYTDEKNKRVAEYIVYCNGMSKMLYIDMPIQAIASSNYGKILAIAGRHSVRVIDVETNKFHEASFRFAPQDKNVIVDMAINPTGKGIIAAGNGGTIQWFSIWYDKEGINIANLKQVKVVDFIKNIYYPNEQDMLYVTEDNIVKSVSILDLIALDSDDLKTTDFDQLEFNDTFIANHFVFAKAFCPEIKKMSEKDSITTIKIFRKNDQDHEEFIFEIPLLEQFYNYITDKGSVGYGQGHMLYSAVGNNHVAVLATDGSMRIWNAPPKKIKKNYVIHNTQEMESKTEFDSIFDTDKKDSKDKITQSLIEEVKTEKRKSSPREMLQKFTRSGSKGSGFLCSSKDSDEKL